MCFMEKFISDLDLHFIFHYKFFPNKISVGSLQNRRPIRNKDHFNIALGNEALQALYREYSM